MGRLLAASVVLLAGFGYQAMAQYTLVLSNKWSLAPGSRYYLPTSGGNPRGLAVSGTTGNVLVPSTQGGSNHVEVVSGVDGSDLGSLSTGGGSITGGTIALMHVGVADDGVVYACNLVTAGSGFKIYRWSAEDLTGTITPVSVFGTPAGISFTNRIGDSFSVRGSGTNTQIIASGTGSPAFTIFTTTDGTNFINNDFRIPTTPGSGGLNRTVVFDGTNNAFWGGKPNDTKLYYITFDLGTLTATTVSNISFSPAMGMCAVGVTNNVTFVAGIQDNGGVVSSSRYLNVFDISNLSATAAGGNVAFPAGGSADGNVTGNTSFGNGMLAALSTQGGIVALNVTLQASLPPSVTTQPVGASGIFAPYTLLVGASGTPTLHYQWLASSDGSTNAVSFTNIPAATASSYTVASATTNYFEAIVTNNFGAATSTPVLVSLLAPVTSTVVTQLWRVPAGANGYPYLSSTDNNTRGIGYDTNSQRVVVSSISGGTAIYILDANNGTNIGTLDLSAANLGGGTFQIDQVAVADDGAVYSGNLALPGQVFNLNRWAAPTTTATAYNGFSDNGTLGFSGDRWGDTMTARGAGATTEILLGSRNGTNVALLTTTDGSNFVASVIAITNAPQGFAANGVAFGVGNTLWAKANLGHLYQVAYDSVGLSGGVVLDYANPSQIPTYMVGVGVDPARNILAGINLADVPNDLQLFQLTGTADAPVLFSQSFFASANNNGNANVAIAMKYPRVYGLDVNNGLVALSYGTPPTTPPVITTPPASQTVYTINPSVILSVGVSGSLPLYYQWRFNGTNLLGATSRSYTLNYPSVSASGNYDVVVHNLAGTVTSTPPAVLTVIAPVSSAVVTQLWTLAGGSRPYLDGYSYSTRGLAYDTNTQTVLVADHNNIYVLAATNGGDLFQLNTVGLPAGYFTLDQVGVADDGAVYGCNLSLDGTGFAITRWDAVSQSAGLFPAYGPADPGNGSGDRYGDTMAVRGSGTGTQIAIGSYGGTNVVVLTTADGSSFTATLIAVAGVPAGFAGQGLAFGAGNTLWAKSPGYNLRQVAFDLSTGTGTVLQTFTAGTQLDSSLGGIGVDSTQNILGGVSFNDNPNDLQLYLLSGNSNPPTLFEQAFFGSNNINSQENSVVTLNAGRAFALDVNNGLVALSYGAIPTPATTILSVQYHAGTGATITWQAVSGRNYQVLYKSALSDAAWTPVGPSIPGSGATASYTDTSAGGSARYYRVQSL